MYSIQTNLIKAQQQLNAPLDSLCFGVMGGSPASPNLFKRIREILQFDNIKVSQFVLYLNSNSSLQFFIIRSKLILNFFNIHLLMLDFILKQSIYGLTEATAVVFQSLINEQFSLSETTVGCLSDHVEAKVNLLLFLFEMSMSNY